MSIIPGIANLTHPIQIRREEDFYLSSTLDIVCNASYQLSYQWHIYNCSASQCSASINVNFPSTSNEYFLPARTLPLGLYKIEFVVTLQSRPLPSMTSTRSIYLLITPSGITANLVLLGTSMITSGIQQDLRFNPGEYSIDLDEDQFNASVRHVSSPSPYQNDERTLSLSIGNMQGLELRILLSTVRSGLFPQLSRPTVDHR